MNKPDLSESEKTYKQIVKFYDLAEQLVETVEDPNVEDPIAQLEFVEPIVEQLESATDMLSEEYRNFIETGKAPGFLTRKRIEKNLRKIYLALDACKQAKEDRKKYDGIKVVTGIKSMFKGFVSLVGSFVGQGFFTQRRADRVLSGNDMKQAQSKSGGRGL